MQAAWQDYERPAWEPLRGMTRLNNRVEFSQLETIRKTKNLSRKDLMKGILASHGVYWTWRSRGWVPLWAVKRAMRLRSRRIPHIDLLHIIQRQWRHKLLKVSEQSYILRPKTNEIRIARKAAFMFARRHGYRIATAYRRKMLYVTRIDD